MKKRAQTILSSISGAALAEFALILPLLVLFTFGIVEFSYMMWQRQQAEQAVAEALRFATTRSLLVASSFNDCGPTSTVTVTEAAGTSCSAITDADKNTWNETCTTSSNNVCNSATLNEMVAVMQQFRPEITASNLQVDLYGAGLGFVGFGKPVPIVKVSLVNMPYDWIAVGDILGFNNFIFNTVSASAPAEDITGT